MNKDKDQDQQGRTIEGQDSEPAKIWHESDQSQYTGYGDTRVGGSEPAKEDQPEPPENEQIDETQWQGNRFGQGGFGSGQGGSNG